MSTKPRKDRSASKAEPDDDQAVPPRKARTVRDHSGAGKTSGEAKAAKSKKKTSGQQPRIARRQDPTASIWTPAIVAVPVGLIALFAIVFMLLVKSSTNAPPPPPATESAPAPAPRPIVLDPEPPKAAPAAADPAPEPEPASAPRRAPAPSSDDAPPIEGDE